MVKPQFKDIAELVAVMRSVKILTNEAIRDETPIDIPPQFFLRSAAPYDILTDHEIRSLIFQKRKELLYPVQVQDIWYEGEPFEQYMAHHLEASEDEIREIMFGFFEKRQNDPIRNCIRKLEYELRNRNNPERKNTKEDLDRKKAEVAIRDVVERYVQMPHRARPGSLIPCPFPEHQDKTSSFMIYDKTNTCKCFGCQKGGSAIDFIMHMEGCSLRDAIQKFLNF